MFDFYIQILLHINFVIDLNVYVTYVVFILQNDLALFIISDNELSKIYIILKLFIEILVLKIIVKEIVGFVIRLAKDNILQKNLFFFFNRLLTDFFIYEILLIKTWYEEIL